MAFSGKTVDIDFKKIFNNIKNYFGNLSQYSLYSWIAIGAGVVLIIASFIV